MNLRSLVYLLLVVSLLSCRTDQEGSTTDEPTTLAPAGSEYEYKHADNTLRIGMRVEPTGLNPVLSTQAASRYVGEMVFQTLNSQDPQTFEQVPLLASLADISREADGTVSYSYLIDERANWPNGLPVTATDVIFSLKIVMNPLILSGAYRPYYDMVSNIVTSPGNEKRFKVMTKRPYLLAEQAIGSLSIYPEYAYDPDGLLRSISLTDLTNNAKAQRMAEENDQLKSFAEAFSTAERSHEPDQVIGSGPYRLVSWEDGQKLTLERREDYWAAKSNDAWMAAKPEKIIFNVIPDAGTMGNALRDELVDVVADMSVNIFKELREDEYLQQRYEFETVPSLKYFGLLLNLQNPLLRDVKTRQA
ncbi:MAG: ABC transporter substrate-binding protein, partial [Bacteroidota bacterium]